MCPHDAYREAEECSACMAPRQRGQQRPPIAPPPPTSNQVPSPPPPVSKAADTIVELRQQLDAARAKIDELENDLRITQNDLRIANEATLVLLTSTCEMEDHLAAALDVIIAIENKDDDTAIEDLQVRLDEMARPYSERRLVVRRRPEYGWAVWDKDTGEKLRPVNPNQWFRDRKTALAAKATEQPLGGA